MDNKIELIYGLLINNLPINNSSLSKIGFTEIEIDGMIKNNILTVYYDEEYKIASVESFYRYGIKLLLLGYLEQANSCFRKCHELEPNNREYVLQLMLYSIRKSNHNDLIKLFSLIDTNDMEENIKDNNMYLYLLSNIMKIPSSYYERVRNLDYDDFLFSYDSDYPYKETENAIRSSIIKNKYKYALKQINDIISNEKGFLVKKLILKELVIKLIKKENKFKYDLSIITKNKEYGIIVAYLEAKSNKRYLKSDESYILLIAKAIVSLLETKEIPNSTIQSTSYMYDAIKGNNFELAKKLNYFYKKSHACSVENDMIDMLLSDIIDLIAQIEHEKINTPEKTLSLINQR